MEVKSLISKPAFPSGTKHPITQQQGMSLLEYYAGQANVSWQEAANAFKEANGKQQPTIADVIEARVSLSFDHAEAMIKEAEKRGK